MQYDHDGGECGDGTDWFTLENWTVKYTQSHLCEALNKKALNLYKSVGNDCVFHGDVTTHHHLKAAGYNILWNTYITSHSSSSVCLVWTEKICFASPEVRGFIVLVWCVVSNCVWNKGRTKVQLICRYTGHLSSPGLVFSQVKNLPSQGLRRCAAQTDETMSNIHIVLFFFVFRQCTLQ